MGLESPRQENSLCPALTASDDPLMVGITRQGETRELAFAALLSDELLTRHEKTIQKER